MIKMHNTLICEGRLPVNFNTTKYRGLRDQVIRKLPSRLSKANTLFPQDTLTLPQKTSRPQIDNVLRRNLRYNPRKKRTAPTEYLKPTHN